MEKKILSLFLYKEKLKFNEIEKQLKIRSNKLAYHLKNLIAKKIIEKDREFYKLSETSEYLIPYLSEKNSPLAVVLVKIGNDSKVFLYKREKRPFAGKLSLPGGRMLNGESIEEATKRIMEKFNIKAKFYEVNSVSLEHVKKNKKKIHSFLLILVSANTKDKIELTEIKKNKNKIISSDYKLITQEKGKIKIETLYTNA